MPPLRVASATASICSPIRATNHIDACSEEATFMDEHTLFVDAKAFWKRFDKIGIALGKALVHQRGKPPKKSTPASSAAASRARQISTIPRNQMARPQRQWAKRYPLCSQSGFHSGSRLHRRTETSLEAYLASFALIFAYKRSRSVACAVEKADPKRNGANIQVLVPEHIQSGCYFSVGKH